MRIGMANRSDIANDIANRRGFFWPSFEIYGGVGGFYDYGPLGVLLKNNIVDKWRRTFVLPYQDIIVEIETPIIMPRVVFEASGHVEHFTDFVVECLSCGRKYRADQLIEEELGKRGIRVKVEGLKEDEMMKLVREHDVRCPACGGKLDNIKRFNLLFQTFIGPYSDNIGYLRPETAQGMFVAFKRIAGLMGKSSPFGVAQVGKVARNEISPRQGLIRLREFSQMEIEMFIDPQKPTCPFIGEVEDYEINVVSEDMASRGVEEPITVSVGEAVRKGIVANEWMGFFLALSQKFMEGLGVPRSSQKFIAKLPHERAHYSTQTFDHLVYTERFGWIEVSGHAYRGDYDLSRHGTYSGEELVLDRRLEEPRIVEERRVYPNPGKIREVYGDRVGEVIMRIEENRDAILRRLESSDSIQLGDLTITRDMVIVRSEKRRVEVEHYVPHVVEPSFGIDRIVYVTLEYAVRVENGRRFLALPPEIAPIKVAVLPIVRKNVYVEIARDIFREISMAGIHAAYDDEGSIGHRYVRFDEVGTPLAITVDERTPKDGTVTVRDRDTRAQIRIPRDRVVDTVLSIISGRSVLELARSAGYELVTQR